MRRVVLTLAAAVAAGFTAACGGGDVVVVAQLAGATTGTEETDGVALVSMEVRLFPFDRDVIFDSLAQAYQEPEPEIPDSIFDLQQRVIETQREWQAANNRWAEVRDRLQSLSDTLRTMDQSSGAYFALFQEFGELESEVNGLQDRADAAFEQFDTLSKRLNQQSQEIRLARQNWGDEAFMSVDSIFDARIETTGREVLYDTTSAGGIARFQGVADGDWYIVARYDRQFDELYWNVPIDVQGGDEPLQIRLTEENAEVRQKL
jgi:hypothetical protein